MYMRIQSHIYCLSLSFHPPPTFSLLLPLIPLLSLPPSILSLLLPLIPLSLSPSSLYFLSSLPPPSTLLSPHFSLWGWPCPVLGRWCSQLADIRCSTLAISAALLRRTVPVHTATTTHLHPHPEGETNTPHCGGEGETLLLLHGQLRVLSSQFQATCIFTSKPYRPGFIQDFFGGKRSLWGTTTASCMSMRLYKFSSFWGENWAPLSMKLSTCTCTYNDTVLTIC